MAVPRLCFLRKWPDCESYGFDLVTRKVKAGHFINKVDDNSPASFSGLKVRDQVIQVNGESINGLSHQKVVDVINSRKADGVKLFVIDEKTQRFYVRQGVDILSDSVHAMQIEGPSLRPPSMADEDWNIESAEEESGRQVAKRASFVSEIGSALYRSIEKLLNKLQL